MPRHPHSSTRDHKILLFIWQWKVVSTRAIQEKIFSGNKSNWAYRVLSELKRKKLLELNYISFNRAYLWSLSKNGFEAIKEFLPELIEESYKPNAMYHDYLSSCVHLGGWLHKIPESCFLFSERQLKAYHPDLYPSWVPKFADFRSDGYWKIGDGKQSKVYSLEVEINLKSKERYREIGMFYDYQDGVDNVIWLIPSRSTASTIDNHLRRSHIKRTGIHNYILINDFLKQGWLSQIILGQLKEKKLKELLRTNNGNSTETLEKPCSSLEMLDARKRGEISYAYENSSEEENPN